jgi:excisionase family DNA binding protein
MEPLAICIRDTTKVLGLGGATIYKMIADGRLQIFKVRRRTLVKTASIRRFVNM